MSLHPTTFEYLKPTDAQLQAMEQMRACFRDIAEFLDSRLPQGRYKALVMTALEEAAMWANKSVTRDADGTPRK
jgi:hypothetical protein